MKFKCSKCGEVFEGQPEQCPKCGAVMTYPKTQTEDRAVSNNDNRVRQGHALPPAIVSVVLEVIFSITLSSTATISEGFAILTLVFFILCTLTSLVCLIINSILAKKGNNHFGAAVTGLIFSAIGTTLGVAFFISLLSATL